MNRDVRISSKVNNVKSELDCCEYINIYGEKRSCLQCFCDCSALDSACDTVCSLECNSTNFDTVCEDLEDRVRIPWSGGAMRVTNHAVTVTTLFCLFLVVGSLNAICLLIASTVMLVVLIRMHCYIVRTGVKSLYFFLLSVLHTVTSVVLYSCKVFLQAESTHIYYFYFWLMIYLSVLYYFKQDAGKVATVPSKNSSHERYCESCSILTPTRAAHCRFCNVCVQKYDHHNIWFDQCVGSRNHPAYIILLVALINLTFSTSFDFFSSSCGTGDLTSRIPLPNCKPYILSNKSSVLFAIGLFSVGVLLVAVYNLIKQIKLITFNITGNEERCLRRGYPMKDEQLRSHYLSSPWDYGPRTNWWNFIVAPSHRTVQLLPGEVL